MVKTIHRFTIELDDRMSRALKFLVKTKEINSMSDFAKNLMRKAFREFGIWDHPEVVGDIE